MTYFLFYFILYPLSILPLALLYIICLPFYILMAFIIRYRRKIIDDNFSKSFPEWSKWQVWKARQRYYIHFAQLAAEMLKMLTMSRKNVLRRYHCSNPEVVNKAGKSTDSRKSRRSGFRRTGIRARKSDG